MELSVRNSLKPQNVPFSSTTRAKLSLGHLRATWQTETGIKLQTRPPSIAQVHAESMVWQKTGNPHHFEGSELSKQKSAFRFRKTLRTAWVRGHIDREQDLSLLQIFNAAILFGADLHPRIGWDKRTKQAVSVTPPFPPWTLTTM